MCIRDRVNNETGSIMPVDELAEFKKQALLHTDAVQAFGKIELPRGADLISVSGHKIHGPKGIGGLWIGEGVRIRPF